jgi:plasmid stabilization system protein ParE
MPSVEFSHRATEQLAVFVQHYDAHSTQVTDRLLQTRAEKSAQLEDWPETGRMLADERKRKLRLDHFPIAPVYEQKGDRVEILRIIDLRSNPANWLE